MWRHGTARRAWDGRPVVDGVVVDVGLGTPALRVERVGLAQREEGVSSGLAGRVLADEAVGVDSERMALPIEALSLQRG